MHNISERKSPSRCAAQAPLRPRSATLSRRELRRIIEEQIG